MVRVSQSSSEISLLSITFCCSVLNIHLETLDSVVQCHQYSILRGWSLQKRRLVSQANVIQNWNYSFFFSSWPSARWYWPVQRVQGHPTTRENWSKASPCLAAEQTKIRGRTVQWWRRGRWGRAVWGSRCKATTESRSEVKAKNKNDDQSVWWWWTRWRWFLYYSSSFQDKQVMKLWCGFAKGVRSQCMNFKIVVCFSEACQFSHTHPLLPLCCALRPLLFSLPLPAFQLVSVCFSVSQLKSNLAKRNQKKKLR